MNEESLSTQNWLDKPISNYFSKITVEKVIIVLILILALVTRFYDVGARVMSHDEVNHVVPSWDLATGKGYRQDPVTHGPLQFHLIAASYFMFGDSDFTSRIPAALASFLTVAVVVLAFKRYLGKWGHIIGGILFLISPYMLFYGRYTRNEAFVALFGVLILYATLRYLDKGDAFSLTLLTVAHALNFTAKETGYFYMAQLLLFLAFQFYVEVLAEKWKSNSNKRLFSILSIAAIVLLLVGIGLGFMHADQNPVTENGEALQEMTTTTDILANIAIIAAVGIGAVAIFFLFTGFGDKKMRKMRSFDLLMLNGTLVLPLLTAFPVKMIDSFFNLNLNLRSPQSTEIITILIIFLIIMALTTFLGLFWNWKVWAKNTIIFWSIFIVFYTTFFTNAEGFVSGLIGSLGYWLDQQAVERGSQPLYYYILLQIPLYEYLAAAGTFLAAIFGIRHIKKASIVVEKPLEKRDSEQEADDESTLTAHYRVPVLLFLLFWSITSMAAYSLAGERMPWLTVHIALPLLLTAAWGLNHLVETIPWQKVKENQSWMLIILIPMLTASFIGLFGSLTSAPLPFQGKSLDALASTNAFILSLVGLIIAIGGIYYFLRQWKVGEILKLFLLGIFLVLTGLTARTAFTAAYINYDNAKEFLVYAHAARGPKDILEQVEEISKRTVGDKQISVAYDNDSLYPYWWYFRDYPNKVWYTDQPTRDLLNSPVILASNENYTKIDALTKGDYISYEYKRLWWPMQDYYFLTWERIKYAVTDANMRAALFDIWLNKDYTAYAQIKGRDDLTLSTWQPSDTIRMYVRNDVAALMWNYGGAPVITTEIQADPYDDKLLDLNADAFLGTSGNFEEQLLRPRGIALAQDGTIYVADSGNHRIMHFAPDGTFINTWGSFASSEIEPAPAGTFNEPWGIAVGPDGSVYVTDTWNHRVQKFSPAGEFITEWGFFGTADAPTGFWGPRGIAVDQDGRVFITDTGNKRIAVFDADGEFITSFGSPGFELGELDEPVGIAVGLEGEVYVADTWNQRIQMFIPDETNTDYTAVSAWFVEGWYGQSLDNKPFLGVAPNGEIYTTDPEGYRVLGFNSIGEFTKGWGGYTGELDSFNMPSAIAFDAAGGAWVADAGSNLIMHFTLP